MEPFYTSFGFKLIVAIYMILGIGTAYFCYKESKKKNLSAFE